MPQSAAVSTAKGESRRSEILHAAARTLVDRGYGDTRIADVAERANVSTALIIYYFKTREQMLLESLKLCETSFYDEAESRMRTASGALDRLALLVEMYCVEDEEKQTMRGLWFELWAQAQRHADVADARAAHDDRWRDLVTHVVREGQFNREVDADIDARRFAVAFAALLDGLSVQVELRDSEVTSEYARQVANDFVRSQLSPADRPRSTKRR